MDLTTVFTDYFEVKTKRKICKNFGCFKNTIKKKCLKNGTIRYKLIEMTLIKQKKKKKEKMFAMLQQSIDQLKYLNSFAKTDFYLQLNKASNY